jgi:hypothetical protein
MRESLDTATDTLDESLVILAATGPEYHGGFANHGPMAAEALHHLDRPEAVLPWTHRYTRRLEPAPASGRPLADEEWPAALGRPERYPDWLARFTVELDERHWTDVVAWWAPALVPGLWGAAGHGVIRAAHATRSLSTRETAARRAELARGLAYWASVYEELPGGTRLAGPRTLPEAMTGIRSLPVPELSGFFITERVDQLCSVVELPAAVDALGPVDVSDLTAAFARAYLANAPHGAIAFCHAVTAPAALRPLLGLLPTELHRDATGAAWRAGAAVLGAFGDQGIGDDLELDAGQLDRDALVDRAIASGDEHAIKLTDACLGEHARNPDPAYLAAAADVTARFRG